MKADKVRAELDRIIPLPPGFPPLRLVEDRHILAAFLLTGSVTRAAQILGMSIRGTRIRLSKYRTGKGKGGRPTRQEEMANELPHLHNKVEEISYPCHRDFEFWDWYMNQDSVRGIGFSRPTGEQRTRSTQPRKPVAVEESDYA